MPLLNSRWFGIGSLDRPLDHWLPDQADLEVGRDYGVLIVRPLGMGMHLGANRIWSQTSLA